MMGYKEEVEELWLVLRVKMGKLISIEADF